MTGGQPAAERRDTVERARQALLDHPALTNKALAALAGCGEMTIQRQRHKLHAEGLIPQPRPHGGGWPDVRDRVRRLAVINPGVSSYQLARLAGCGNSTAWHAQNWLRTEATMREQAEIWAAAYPDAPVTGLADISGISRHHFRGLRPTGGHREPAPLKIPRLFWQAHLGLCSQPGADPEDWTGDDPAGHKRAIAICARCPVRNDCLAFAMQFPAHQDHCVWGGMTAPQRQRLRQSWQRQLATA